MEQAALKIQSTFRGHKVRKGKGGEDEPESKEEEPCEVPESDPPQNNDDDDIANMVLDDDMENAALKIQATFRGHKTRKDMKKGDESSENPEEMTEESQEAVEEKEEEKNEEPAEEAKPESVEKTAQQLQDEEDVASMVNIILNYFFLNKLSLRLTREGPQVSTEFFKNSYCMLIRVISRWFWPMATPDLGGPER